MTTSPTKRVTDALPLIESVASAIAAEARSRHCGAEYDDLRQEGMIAAWLEDPEEDLESLLVQRMRTYVKRLARQAGRSRR